MKGIVFSEFLDMVEERFGLPVVQEIIDACDLETDGAYTAVGTYDHREMFQMVGKLSEIENIPVNELLEVYGKHFFDVLRRGYPQFFAEQQSVFQFFSSIDNYIHPEVLKLYPDAELPQFTSEKTAENEMIMVYRSSRKLSRFAVGLIKSAGIHFDTPIKVTILEEKADGAHVVLKLEQIES